MLTAGAMVIKKQSSGPSESSQMKVIYKDVASVLAQAER